ncbi:MAG: YdiU family protein [Motiliproteus sp.]
MFTSALLQPSHYLELEFQPGGEQPQNGHGDFLARVQPKPLRQPELFHLNLPLINELGLTTDHFSAQSFTNHLNCAPLPAHITPLATAYSGHQFGQFNPTLGDGRAMLIGDLIRPDGKRCELQFKGAGPTPYSRGADGRAVLRSVIREYLASEAIAALNIPTTRALCIISSQTPVWREQQESAALMIRSAPSHLRFGTFEHFYARNQLNNLKRLVDFSLSHDFPELPCNPQGYALWFTQIVQSTARLMAQWQSVGFCHGVMNTDNFSILGLTLDYGPYGFLEQYDPAHICNHSDHQGRYAFDRQPGIGYWNCLCLARALSPLIDKPSIEQALASYEPTLQQSYLNLMRQKLGLLAPPITESDITETAEDADTKSDESLIGQLLQLLTEQKLDYSRFLRGLGYWLQNQQYHPWVFQRCEQLPIEQWLILYRQRLDQLKDNLSDQQRGEQMNRQNPKFVLRNYLAQRAIEQSQQGDNSELDRLLSLLQQPFDEHPQWQDYAEPAVSGSPSICVSCSS